MILIGQYDSPFVRRVGIALTLYELPFEHWPWSTFGDADRLVAYNPLLRVPVLVTDDGDILLDSWLPAFPTRRSASSTKMFCMITHPHSGSSAANGRLRQRCPRWN
jgi:hypothetical protein